MCPRDLEYLGGLGGGLVGVVLVVVAEKFVSLNCPVCRLEFVLRSVQEPRVEN